MNPATTAARYDAAAVLARETGRRMAERLDLVKIAPRCIADIGCATGDGIRELQRRYPQALPLAIDDAPAILAAVRSRSPLLQRLRGRAPRCLNAATSALPVTDNSLDLVWSNLALHWQDDLRPTFAELHRTLRPGGLLMFSMFGPDTLKELRVAGADSLRKFHDMHDIGDMLVAAGFADPVMDMEMISLTYATLRAFLRDQRHLGVRDALLGRQSWRDWRRIFSAWQRADGRLPASFEIVYGHAWKVAPRGTPQGGAPIRFTRRR